MIRREQEDMRNAEKAELTPRKPENTLEGMMNAVRDSLSDLASFNDEEDGEDQHDYSEDTKLCKLSEDDEPLSVMGTISNTGQLSEDSFWQKQMSLDKLMQLQMVDEANIFRKRDMN